VGGKLAADAQENMSIRFLRLTEVASSDIIELMNDPRVRRQMPLSHDEFGAAECAAFIAAKEHLWAEHGFGPWAFIVDDSFAGWGGLQPEDGEADLALVLHPGFWGMGKLLYEEVLRRAFGEMDFDSVTVLLPPTRTRTRGLFRLGFLRDGELIIGGERFLRFRLRRPQAQTGEAGLVEPHATDLSNTRIEDSRPRPATIQEAHRDLRSP